MQSFLNWSATIGSFFGIPIKLHITLLFFVIPAFRMAPNIGAGYAIEIVLGIVLSVLIHELGHALAAKAYKLNGLSITLHGFGGFAVSQGFRTPRQALVIVLMGPLTNFVLFGLGLATTIAGVAAFEVGIALRQQAEIIGYLAFFNLIMGIANLIPMLPFDGGQAIAAILSNHLSVFKAQRRVAHLGLLVGPISAFYGIASDESLLTVFGIIGAITSYSVLTRSGGIRFFEFLDDRKLKREVVASKRRENERHQRYLQEVAERESKRSADNKSKRLIE